MQITATRRSNERSACAQDRAETTRGLGQFRLRVEAEGEAQVAFAAASEVETLTGRVADPRRDGARLRPSGRRPQMKKPPTGSVHAQSGDKCSTSAAASASRWER